VVLCGSGNDCCGSVLIIKTSIDVVSRYVIWFDADADAMGSIAACMSHCSYCRGTEREECGQPYGRLCIGKCICIWLNMGVGSQSIILDTGHTQNRESYHENARALKPRPKCTVRHSLHSLEVQLVLLHTEHRLSLASCRDYKYQ